MKDSDKIKGESKTPHILFCLAAANIEGRHYEQALTLYEERASMGGSDEEVYESLYRIGILKELLHYPLVEVLKSFETAYFFCPSRAEPLYCLANAHILAGRFLLGYVTAQLALTLVRPPDCSVSQAWMYEYGIRYQLAQCAYQIGKVRETQEAFERLLAVPTLPKEYRERIEYNLTLINKRNAL